ncbi:hypothetical protein ACU61A_12520 [Pseudonocardia sichuanensis]
MSNEHEPADPYRPGAALPDPTTASGPTRWTAPAADYAGRADGTSRWADEPSVAVVLPEVEPVTERVGWLTGRGPSTP